MSQRKVNFFINWIRIDKLKLVHTMLYKMTHNQSTLLPEGHEMLCRQVAIHIGSWLHWKKKRRAITFYSTLIQNLWIYGAVLLVCLFEFFMDTVIICPDTENVAASYPSSLNGNSDFDVVYLSFQNTSTQTCTSLLSFDKWQLSFLCLWKLLLYHLKENERIVFQSLFVFHPGEEEVFDTRL